MKWFAIALPIVGLILLLGYTTGLIGTGKYVSNYEHDEYDSESTFPEPTIITDSLAVYIVGEGEPILVIPYPHAGTNEPMAQSDFSEMFLELGRKVITFDVPGAYASTREPKVDMNEMLDCAIDTLKAAGVDGEIDVAGHSMGGLVALAFALEHPERVDQLLLINTLSGFDASLKWGMPGSAWNWNQKEYWQLMYWGIRLQNGRGNLEMHKRLMHLMREASYIDKSFVPPLKIEEDDKDKPTPIRFKWSKALWNINYADELDLVKASTLITAGRYDPQTPIECAQELTEGIPNNELVVFENSGHYPFVEEKDEFLEVIGTFLEAR